MLHNGVVVTPHGPPVLSMGKHHRAFPMFSLPLPVLACPACGVIDRPRVEAGRGPHVAAAVCGRCGHFLKRLPRALVEPLIDRKEAHLMGGVNRVVLLGTLSKYGVTVKYATSGTACASFTLIVTEQGQDGKEHQTLVDCECWGKKAEAAGEYEAGQIVLFEGKLRKRPKGEGQWEMIVSGFEVTPVLAPAATLTGNPN